MLKPANSKTLKRANGSVAQVIPALKSAGLSTLRESRLKTAGVQTSTSMRRRTMQTFHRIRYQIICTILSVIALALSFTVASRSENQQANDPEQQKLVGTWQGILDAGAVKLRLVLKVAKEPNGSLKATMDSPDQGATDLPFASIAITGSAVRLEMTSPAEAIYEGTLSNDGSEIS